MQIRSAREIETVPVRLHPAEETEPPLQYSLLPPFAKLKPGNAAIFHYRALLLMPREQEFQVGETQEAWLKLPLPELP